jgi:hypothetical protein
MTRNPVEMAALLADIFAHPAGFSFAMAHPVQGDPVTIHTAVEYKEARAPEDNALAGRIMETLMLMATGIVDSPLRNSSNVEPPGDESGEGAPAEGPAETSTADITHYLDSMGSTARFEDVHCMLGVLAHSAVSIKITGPTREYSNGCYMSFLALAGSIVASDAVIVLEYELNRALWNIVQL